LRRGLSSSAAGGWISGVLSEEVEDITMAGMLAFGVRATRKIRVNSKLEIRIRRQQRRRNGLVEAEFQT
jgi:hypothetical protein